mgnify:CR=1 FL=1
MKAYAKSRSGIANASLYWRTDTTQAYAQVNMTLAQDTFRASIPAQPLGTNVYYYISARSNSNRTVTKPITAPSGYFRFRIDNPTSINENQINPEEYTLGQNYPNPFNPQTVINFSIGSSDVVELVVYDALGREVATLLNEFRNAGENSVTFDASSIAGGVYYYRLRAGEFTDVKKMIVLK